MSTRNPSAILLAAALVAAFASLHGCTCGTDSNELPTGAGGQGVGAGAQGGAGGTLFTTGGSGGSTPQCVNLECQQVACPGSATTSLSGTVYDPSGTLPIYGVIVYVPNAPLDPIADELSCDQCATALSGSPLVAAITDTQGRFTLTNVPVGADIPLVLQIGKWRRAITVPSVSECVDTPLTDPNQTRLPRSSAEGHLPRIALTTGSADPLFCLLRRLGIDDGEFGVQGSAARIHFYVGANGATAYDPGFGASPGATFPDATQTLWDTGWGNYDIVLLSCEASEQPGAKDGHRVALRDYVDLGGRVFATHYHYNWFQGDAPADLQSVATFSSNQNNFDGLVDIDLTFPKGVALADWLDFVDGASPYGQFNVVAGRRHTQTVDQSLARIWVRRTPDPVYFSFNAPIGAPEPDQCGRMVFSDIHVSAGAGDANGDFPSACSNNPLTEQEKALIFMLFDLSACIVPDDETPCPPGQSHCGQPADPACVGQCVNSCCQEIPQ
ncbi:MAG: carboxypeptidase regulatory-like domain-containing protein [Myxococcales bacterium]|nr:carboxypeptidase regulatory-like domain-containing protein [Myxococcales bacterium]